jgi:hypothetical protein
LKLHVNKTESWVLELYLKDLIERLIFENSWSWYRDFNSEPKKKLKNRKLYFGFWLL